MKWFNALVLSLIIALPWPAKAAEPAVAVYWYSIVITNGHATTTFTGASPYDPTDLAARLSRGNDAVVLEKLREQFARENPRLEFGWHPYREGSKVFILPRTVLYFVALPGDPAAATE